MTFLSFQTLFANEMYHLLKCLVVSSVQEWIVAGATHGHDVADEEHEVVVFPAVDGKQVQVVEEIDGVEREPADAKNQDHGD